MIIKYKYLWIMLFILGNIFTMNGCLQKPASISEPGQLHLKLSLMEEQIRSQTIAGDIRQINVKLTHKDDTMIKETQVTYTGSNQEISFDSLFPGEWQVTASGLNNNIEVIFQGTETIFIKPGETANAQISLIPAPGFLNVSCDVSQINGLSSDSNGTLYAYLNPENSTSTYYTLIRDGNLVKATVSIPEGTFAVKVAVPNVSAKLFISPYYTIDIRAGKTSYLTITADGSVNVSGVINSTPTTPGNLVANYSSQALTVTLTWTGVNDSDLAGYRLYRSNSDGRMVRIKSVDKNSITYTDQVTSSNFYKNEIDYAVSSYDLGGVESLWSEITSVRK